MMHFYTRTCTWSHGQSYRHISMETSADSIKVCNKQHWNRNSESNNSFDKTSSSCLVWIRFLAMTSCSESFYSTWMKANHTPCCGCSLEHGNLEKKTLKKPDVRSDIPNHMASKCINQPLSTLLKSVSSAVTNSYSYRRHCQVWIWPIKQISCLLKYFFFSVPTVQSGKVISEETV